MKVVTLASIVTYVSVRMWVLFCSVFGGTSTVCHIYCNGGESKATDCNIKHGCSCNNVAGVSCSK